MYLTQISMELPTQLWSLVAHAVKWICDVHASEILSVRLTLEGRVSDQTAPTTCMQQVHDLLTLRNFEKCNCSVIIEFADYGETTYKLMAVVADKQAGLKTEVVKRPERPII
jgi:hypothetical protein